MPGHLVKVLVPCVLSPPSAVRWAAGSAAWTIRMQQAKSLLKRIGSAIWVALERDGQSRARRELLAFASRCGALQPEFAKEFRAFASRTE